MKYFYIIAFVSGIALAFFGSVKGNDLVFHGGSFLSLISYNEEKTTRYLEYVPIKEWQPVFLTILGVMGIFFGITRERIDYVILGAFVIDKTSSKCLYIKDCLRFSLIIISRKYHLYTWYGHIRMQFSKNAMLINLLYIAEKNKNGDIDKLKEVVDRANDWSTANPRADVKVWINYSDFTDDDLSQIALQIKDKHKVNLCLLNKIPHVENNDYLLSDQYGIYARVDFMKILVMYDGLKANFRNVIYTDATKMKIYPGPGLLLHWQIKKYFYLGGDGNDSNASLDQRVCHSYRDNQLIQAVNGKVMLRAIADMVDICTIFIANVLNDDQDTPHSRYRCFIPIFQMLTGTGPYTLYGMIKHITLNHPISNVKRVLGYKHSNVLLKNDCFLTSESLCGSLEERVAQGPHDKVRNCRMDVPFLRPGRDHFGEVEFKAKPKEFFPKCLIVENQDDYRTTKDLIEKY